MHPERPIVSDERKQDLKRRWLELNGSEQSFERWIGHHDVSFRTGLTFTEDGHTFSPPQPLFDPSWRVWRPHTFDGLHYVIGFRCHGQSWRISPELERMIPVADSIEMFESASLFASEDGLQWSHVSDIGVDDNDEPDFDFTDGGPHIGRQSNRRVLECGATRHGICERSTVHRLAKIDLERAAELSRSPSRGESAGW